MFFAVNVRIEQQLKPNPILCFLRSIPESVRSQKNTIFLLMKAVMTMLTGDELPLYTFVSDYISLESFKIQNNKHFTVKFVSVEVPED